MTFPPAKIFPPCALIAWMAFSKSCTALAECTGPRRVPLTRGSPFLKALYAETYLVTNLSYTLSCTIILLRVVHLCPAVPTAEKMLPLKASSKSASSMIIPALLPPSSKIVLPNLLWTTSETCLPTGVEPVKETRLILGSLIRVSPTSAPVPWQTVWTDLKPCLSRTSATILPTATVVKDTVSEPFQIIWFPQARAITQFQPETAQGKLKAEMQPITPRGFQTSIMKWPGLSDWMTLPENILESPQAMSAASMYSCTSPSPSDLILPISSEIKEPRASLYFLRASPI
mmetsp:Transcript_4487/g.3760  ORF Transcript_4487/g.3760 Transcript_4487/m.3760 type:complete len:287 (-) Transcript_4487:252-1112(-)